jgi:phytoene synthase
VERQDFAEVVRAASPDRYHATLYAPKNKRDALSALYAFDVEVAAIRERVREPLPGEIRLQWWRDSIAGEGDGVGHPVAAALIATIREHKLPVSAFENLLEARIFDLYADPMPSRTDLEGYCGEVHGAVMQLAALILNADAAPAAAEAAGHGGCAQGMAFLLRSVPQQRAWGQCFVPRDILAATGSSPEAFSHGEAGPNERAAVAALLALARDHLARFEAAAHGLPATLRPAFLPLAVTPLQLDRLRDPAQVLAGTTRNVPAWRRQWAVFRRASRGW